MLSNLFGFGTNEYNLVILLGTEEYEKTEENTLLFYSGGRVMISLTQRTSYSCRIAELIVEHTLCSRQYPEHTLRSRQYARIY
jgi:hypothetical protein